MKCIALVIFYYSILIIGTQVKLESQPIIHDHIREGFILLRLNADAVIYLHKLGYGEDHIKVPFCRLVVEIKERIY